MTLLKKFAMKLSIEDNEFDRLVANPTKYSVERTANIQKRLRRMFEMSEIIFADHFIDETEKEMAFAFARELDFSSQYAIGLVNRSIAMYPREATFTDYTTFVERTY